MHRVICPPAQTTRTATTPSFSARPHQARHDDLTERYDVHQLLRRGAYGDAVQPGAGDSNVSPFGRADLLSHASDAVRLARDSLGWHNPSRSQAGQLAGCGQLRVEDLRFWTGSSGNNAWKETQQADGVRRNALVPGPGSHALQVRQSRRRLVERMCACEMLGKRVLFPGQGYVHQLDCIFAILGSPTDEELASGYSVKSIDYIRKVLPVRQKLPWREVYPHASQASLDLLDRLLTFSTDRRISTGDAARHAYVRGWADEIRSRGNRLPPSAFCRKRRRWIRCNGE
ncbi:hypothetical protein EPUL_006397, partial [Erysiphe pulchra]